MGRSVFSYGLGTGLLLAGVAVSPIVSRAQSVITGSQQVSAVVETVDTQAKELLLRRNDGALVTIHYGRSVDDLPQLHPGDHLTMGYVATLDAHLAKADSPLPESTLAESKGYWNGHPHGVIASFRRERVHVISVGDGAKSISFVGPDNVTRVVGVREKAMQDFVSTLKVGDVVDVTHADSISYSIVRAPNP